MDEHRVEQNLAIAQFRQWMRNAHPGVRLAEMQCNWINFCLAGGQALWAGGHGTGREYIEELWLEYVRAQDPDGRYIYVPTLTSIPPGLATATIEEER